uniref:Protein CASC3 n=1 Tax=Lygus hesperus TaxID=30085 RepID=A0A0A9XH90_LYGHE
MSDGEKVVSEESQVKNDDVDDNKSVASSSDAMDKMSTSTYNTAQNDEEGLNVTAHRDDVTVDDAEDVQNGVREADDTVNDHEDDDGQLSDDQKSNGSSIAGSSGGSQVPDTEREEGDGQEEGDKKDKKLDHDEDRRDPQYIPKRGVFYEHDDRTLDDEPADKKEPVREPKKSKAFEAVERWGHDMYNEDEQSPKSTQELIDMYGYDIRKEEAPPKARRRRRYGKGPNKYQRSWEDEQAYNKTPTRGGFKGQKRSPRNFVQRDEDFPALGPKTDVDVSAGPPSGDTALAPQRNDSDIKFIPKLPPKDVILPSKDEVKAISDQLDAEERIRPAEFPEMKLYWPTTRGPVVEKGVDGGRPSRSLTMRGRADMHRRGMTGHDQLPPFPGKNHHGDRPSDKHGKGASTADEDIATLAQHFSNAVINVDRNIAPIGSTSEPPAEDRPQRESRREDTKHQGHHHHHHHKHGGEKLLQSEKHHGGLPLADKHHQPPDQPSTKSKRYSTQRQRPAQQMNSGTQAQTGAPPAPPAPTPPGYLPPQQGMCPPEGTPHMSAPPPAQFPPPPGGMQMVTFLPGVPPPPANTFHPPPNVYVPPTPYIPPPPLVQPPPAEVYQGGVTYYNTQSQVLTRAAPSRRVKLAIPIVSPDNSQPIQ